MNFSYYPFSKDSSTDAILEREEKKGGCGLIKVAGNGQAIKMLKINNHKSEEHLKSIQTSETELCPN